MTPREFKLHHSQGGTAIHVRVLPRSSRPGVVEILEDGTIKIRLRSAPVDGKANEELIGLISEILEVRKSQISILAGALKKDKLISILNVEPESVQAKMTKKIPRQ